MAITLKEKYEARRLQRLQEKVSRINAELLEEHRVARLIVEAMDEEELNKASAVLDKLENLVSKLPNAKSLKAAVDAATNDINKYTGGGSIGRAWQKMKSKLSGGENPIVKAMALASALERGFQLLPKIVKNLKIEKAEGDSLKDRLGGDNVAAGTPGANDKIQAAQGMLIKAFTPGGLFGAFKKLPYADVQGLVNDIMTSPIAALTQAQQTIEAGPKTADIAPELKDDLKKGANVSGEKKSGESKSGEAPSGAKTASPTTSGETPAAKSNEKPAEAPKAGGEGLNDDQVKDLAGRLAARLPNKIKADDAARVIAAIRDLGKKMGYSIRKEGLNLYDVERVLAEIKKSDKQRT
jgi:hypothetical protein